MKVGTRYLVVFVMVMFCSCTKRDVSLSEYYKYINDGDNGLSKRISIGDWEYTFLYKPYEFIICQEQQGKPDLKAKEKRMKELKGTAWFNIAFKVKSGEASPLRYGINTYDDYNDRLNFFLNNAAKDIKLVYGTDTLHPTSYLFETNYNLTPQETMIVGFILPGKDEQPVKDMVLSYQDEIFKNGIIKAKYTQRDIENIPHLTY